MLKQLRDFNQKTAEYWANNPGQKDINVLVKILFLLSPPICFFMPLIIPVAAVVWLYKKVTIIRFVNFLKEHATDRPTFANSEYELNAYREIYEFREGSIYFSSEKSFKTKSVEAFVAIQRFCKGLHSQFRPDGNLSADRIC